MTDTGTRKWRESVHKFIDQTEVKLTEFEHRVEAKAKKMEDTAAVNTGALWEESQLWLGEKIEELRSFEQKAEQAIDEARVQAHLGKMEAKEMLSEVTVKLDLLKAKVDYFRNKSNTKAAEGLGKLSEACLGLRNRLMH